MSKTYFVKILALYNGGLEGTSTFFSSRDFFFLPATFFFFSRRFFKLAPHVVGRAYCSYSASFLMCEQFIKYRLVLFPLPAARVLSAVPSRFLID